MKKRNITEKMIETFSQYLVAEEKSTATIEKYIRDVKAFMLYANNIEIKKEIALSYKQHLIDSGYAIRNINSMIASTNSIFELAGWTDCKIKAIKLQQEIYRPEKKELTREEYMRLVNTAKRTGNEKLALIIQTICGTGIRVSELQFITVESICTGEATVNLKGKTRKVFLVSGLRQILKQYIKKNKIKIGSVFLGSNCKSISRVTVWRMMKLLCKTAGVLPSKVFSHNLRKQFARVFYKTEKDIAKLADTLGHSSINTTRIYLISTGEEHRRRMENMRLIVWKT